MIACVAPYGCFPNLICNHMEHIRFGTQPNLYSSGIELVRHGLVLHDVLEMLIVMCELRQQSTRLIMLTASILKWLKGLAGHVAVMCSLTL